MTTAAVKFQPKRMALGIPPEIQKTMDAVQEVVAATNIPTQHFPSNRPAAERADTVEGADNVGNVRTIQSNTHERKTRGPKPAQLRRYSVDLPHYLIEEITDKAYKKKCKKRVLILNAFKDAGFTIKDIDLQESKNDE